MVATRFHASSGLSLGDAQIPAMFVQLPSSGRRKIALGQGQQFAATGIDFGETTVAMFTVTKGVMSAGATSRSAESLVMFFLLSGKMRLVDEDAESDIAFSDGDICLFGMDTNFGIHVDEEAKFLSVSLPTQVIAHFGQNQYPALGHLDSNASMVAPTLAFLKAAVEAEGDIASVAAYFMENLVHEMVGGILLEDFGAIIGGTTRPSVFKQALAYIAATAGNSELTPQTLADELSVSVRQLQREFKQQGLTVSETIKRQRVELAVQLLKDPRLEVLSLEKIAEHAGFTSLIQLRRALGEANLGHPSRLRSSSHKIVSETTENIT